MFRLLVKNYFLPYSGLLPHILLRERMDFISSLVKQLLGQVHLLLGKLWHISGTLEAVEQ